MKAATSKKPAVKKPVAKKAAPKAKPEVKKLPAKKKEAVKPKPFTISVCGVEASLIESNPNLKKFFTKLVPMAEAFNDKLVELGKKHSLVNLETCFEVDLHLKG